MSGGAVGWLVAGVLNCGRLAPPPHALVVLVLVPALRSAFASPSQPTVATAVVVAVVVVVVVDERSRLEENYVCSVRLGSGG